MPEESDDLANTGDTTDVFTDDILRADFPFVRRLVQRLLNIAYRPV